MFNITSIENYIKKLADLKIYPERIKKVNSLETFLTWLKKKKIVNGPQYLSLQGKINNLKKDESVNEASLSPNNLLIPTESKNITPKILFITLNIIVVLTSFIYFQTFLSKQKSNITLAKDTGRILNYEGRLIDSEGKPISNKRDISFKIYDVANGGLPLYTGGCIGERALVPEYNGKFTVLIGQDCKMNRIPSSVFSLPQDLYLGISIGSDKEMTPRQKIAKSSYALEADKLKGMTLGASTGSIPYIDSNGRLLIDATSPTIHSSSGMLTVEGQSITLQTLSKENGSIYFLPAEDTIIASGNLGIGTMHPTAKLDVSGDASISGNLFFSTLQTQIGQLKGGNISFSTSTAGDELLTPKMTIYNSGNIQVGLGEGEYKFNVSEYARGTSVTALTNTSTEDNVDTNVLKLRLGTDKSGTLSKFVEFYANSTSSSNGEAVGRIRLNNGNVAYETGSADFAEYFPVNEETGPGDIISVTERGNFKARENESFIGVVSDTAGFIGNARNEANNKIVGLVGQIETNVTSINGEINVGDSISLSKVPGYGTKSLKEGEIIGKALQSLKYTDPSFQNNTCPEDFKNVTDLNGKRIICGKIRVLIQKGWYDPNINLTDNKVNINDLGLLKPQNTNSNYSNISKYSLIKNLLTTNVLLGYDIKSIFLSAKNFTAEQFDAIDGTLENLTAGKITSPLITSQKIITDDLTTNSIQTTQDKIEIRLDKKVLPSDKQSEDSQFAELVIKGFNNKTVASIDASGNASFSGVLSAKEASVSGNLYAKNITSDTITSLENSIDTLQKKVDSNSASDTQLLQSDLDKIKQEIDSIKSQKIPNAEYYQNLDNTDLLTQAVSQTLAQTLPTTQSVDSITISSMANIFNASISNNLVVGQILVKDDSIVSLASELKISSLEKINFFNTAIIMSKDGSIVTTGSLTAKGGIKTPSLQSLDKDLTIEFGSKNETQKNGKVTFVNSNKEEVSSINEQGEAKFSKLTLKTLEEKNPSVINPSDNYEKNGLYTSAIETGKTSAGVGLLPQSVQELVIYNDTINDKSLVYLTPTSTNASIGLSVSEKKTCNSEDIQNQVCKPYFKVIANKQNQLDNLSFNWLVIN